MEFATDKDFCPYQNNYDEDDGIPWHDPGFGRRMLKVHLSQDHDWASRRFEVIDKHIDWIKRQLPERQNKILDLCCGPGFYAHRLAGFGHRCTGVDFSPAAIDYARRQARTDRVDVEYLLEDVRTHEFKDGYDLAMMIFGDFNQFDRTIIIDILKRVVTSLNEGGMLVVEVHTFDDVRCRGMCPPQWHATEEGIFSDEPYRCLQTHEWDDAQCSTSTSFLISDEMGMPIAEYFNTMHAYTDQEYRQMLEAAGLGGIRILNDAEWPTGDIFSGKLRVYCGRRRSKTPGKTSHTASNEN